MKELMGPGRFKLQDVTVCAICEPPEKNDFRKTYPKIFSWETRSRETEILMNSDSKLQ